MSPYDFNSKSNPRIVASGREPDEKAKIRVALEKDEITVQEAFNSMLDVARGASKLERPGKVNDVICFARGFFRDKIINADAAAGYMIEALEILQFEDRRAFFSVLRDFVNNNVDDPQQKRWRLSGISNLSEPPPRRPLVRQFEDTQKGPPEPLPAPPSSDDEAEARPPIKQPRGGHGRKPKMFNPQ